MYQIAQVRWGVRFQFIPMVEEGGFNSLTLAGQEIRNHGDMLHDEGPINYSLSSKLTHFFLSFFLSPSVTVDVHNTFPLNIEDMIENGEFKTLRPIIGIVSMPIRGANILENLNTAQNESHIAASFVKLVEGAGGRVVPLVETFNDTMIKMLLKSINGVLLPGGSDALIRSNYRRISALAYEYSISMYKKGITWPVFGICRGFQMLMALEMNEEKPTIASTDAMNLTLSLEFTKEAEKSRLFGNASSGIMEILEKERVTFNAHNNGITTKLFEKHTELQEAWRVLSTNRDRNGKEFISTFEGQYFSLFLLLSL